jgi:hypothetical protein
LEEIRSGGPPPDGIPPVDHPRFVSVSAAEGWIEEREPVLSLLHGGEARAYPLQILTWHEIVNDRVHGDPITVTFCPLCNTGIAFDRRVRGDVLDFGTSGRLYRSNLVMYDRQTKSLWVQFTGKAITGSFIGTELRRIPVQIVSWREFTRAHPKGRVLSKETGFSREYGRNPYPGYDDINSSPFLFEGRTDGRLRPMERVVTVSAGDDARAYPYRELKRSDVVEDEVGGKVLVIFYRPGAASALDNERLASGRDVGETGVFSPFVEHRRLHFESRDGRFVDTETGSVWNVLGEATAGRLRGSSLRPVAHDDTFWFVWAAFRPGTTIWTGR